MVMSHYRSWLCALLCLAAAACVTIRSGAQVEIGGPTAAISGSYTLPNGTFVPDFYTWGDTISFTGSGWFANDTLQVHMVGPLNLPGAASHDLILGSIITDSAGRLSPGPNTRLKIPSIHRLSTQPDTPHPGSYSIYAQRPAPTPFQLPVTSFPNTINLSPRTIPFSPLLADFILWAKERGGRDGQLGDKSPERTDPEWVSVWDERPVAFYGTVAETGLDGAHQPAFISHEDYPASHYAHDVNLLVVPDQDYRWLLADANYNSAADPARNGRIEWEWETQNSGSPFLGSYGHGNIGIPLFAMPSAGDRIYTVGRWCMDNGHPDTGDRTEMHPPRMLATIRKRNTAVPFAPFSIATRASQVDVYVSGHGGGANMFPDGLSGALNRGTLGGGSIFDVLTGSLFNTYFAFGPADLSLFGELVNDHLGGNTDLIRAVAGPSAFGWFNGPQERPVNDMNYDFDVPLPTPPAGAGGVHVKVSTHPEHTTAVTEQITYTNPNPVTGLPTTAHIHLPYLGADSGIYARTLNFYWDKFNPPGKHYRVQLDKVTFFLYGWMSGRTYMWADVCGQWSFLTGLDPNGFLNANATLGSFLSGTAPFDVYLDPNDTLRVFTSGYDQEDYDALFGIGGDIGKSAYDGGIDIAKATIAAQFRTLDTDPFSPTFGDSASDGENVDLGGDLNGLSSSGFFHTQYSVTYIPRPPSLRIVGADGTGDLGKVCFGSTGGLDVLVINDGEQPLVVTSVTIAGAGYTVVPGLPTPFTVAGGALIDLNVSFKPTQITQGAGTLTINSNDPLQSLATYDLTATVGHPVVQATAGTTRTPTLVVGATTTWPVTITNPGTCTLIVTPSIAGAGFSMVLPAGYINPFTGGLLKSITVPPGGTNTDLTVKFVTPSVGSKFVGTLTLRGNDPVTPTTTLVFGAEGVPVGMRVLVVGSDGTPYHEVDKITIKSKHEKPKTDIEEEDVHLTTIDPPKSWQRIQYHFQTALRPTDDADDFYELHVNVGKKSEKLKFTIAPGEFKQIVITLP